MTFEKFALVLFAALIIGWYALIEVNDLYHSYVIGEMVKEGVDPLRASCAINPDNQNQRPLCIGISRE